MWLKPPHGTPGDDTFRRIFYRSRPFHPTRSCRRALRHLVDGKNNEITAAPGLLPQLDGKGATVRLDATGCQKKIAREIRFAGGDYLLALKANHGTLRQAPAGPRASRASGSVTTSTPAAVKSGLVSSVVERKIPLNAIRSNRHGKTMVRFLPSPLGEPGFKLLHASPPAWEWKFSHS